MLSDVAVVAVVCCSLLFFAVLVVLLCASTLCSPCERREGVNKLTGQIPWLSLGMARWGVDEHDERVQRALDDLRWSTGKHSSGLSAGLLETGGQASAGGSYERQEHKRRLEVQHSPPTCNI